VTHPRESAAREPVTVYCRRSDPARRIRAPPVRCPGWNARRCQGYAVELELLPANPLNLVRWRAPRAARGRQAGHRGQPGAGPGDPCPGGPHPAGTGRVLRLPGCFAAAAAACSASRSTAGVARRPPGRARPGRGRHPARPAPLRPAARRLSLWLSASRKPAEIAARADTSTRVLHDVYVHCIHGQKYARQPPRDVCCDDAVRYMSVPTGSLQLTRTDSHGHRPCNALTSTNLKAGSSPTSYRARPRRCCPVRSDRIAGINLVRTAAVTLRRGGRLSPRRVTAPLGPRVLAGLRSRDGPGQCPGVPLHRQGHPTLSVGASLTAPDVISASRSNCPALNRSVVCRSTSLVSVTVGPHPLHAPSRWTQLNPMRPLMPALSALGRDGQAGLGQITPSWTCR
jgi:hypothetical protein